MEDKIKLLEEIKELFDRQNLKEFEISKELLEYLEIEDLRNLKRKILSSLSNLDDEQKEWLKGFIKD
ncbi:MAG: hypothetical protein GXN91_02485 [Epsilonproteobacteria bacterium]|nr:hypothetical protein [Campylobacterota bacterium]